MFCVMLHQDARTALTETCHRKALWTSVFPLINSIVWATCIRPFENSKQVVCTFVIDYTVTYTYLAVKKCSSAYFFEVKAVPQKEAKLGRKKNLGSVCLLQESPQKNNFIWARWAYLKKKQLSWDQNVKGSSTVNYAFCEVNTR